MQNQMGDLISSSRVKLISWGTSAASSECNARSVTQIELNEGNINYLDEATLYLNPDNFEFEQNQIKHFHLF